MAARRQYRHRITGLIGEYEQELADVFKHVLDPVEDAPAVAPVDPEPADEPQDTTPSEESK